MKRIFTLAQGNSALPFLVEKEAFEGVKKIAEKVIGDVEKVAVQDQSF